MSHLITGLDLGSAQIKGLIVERKKQGNFSVVSVFKQPAAGFRKGVLVDVEEATQTLRSLMLDLQKISKKAIKNIVASVNGEHIISRPSRGMVSISRGNQEINQYDIEQVLEHAQAVKRPPNYLILHNIVKDYIIDDVGDIFDPLGMTGSRLEVNTLAVEAFSPHLNNLINCLEKVGGSLAGGLIFSPLAASRAVLSKRQKELGVLLIDFGAQTTSLAVFEEGKVSLVKSLPLGSVYVTNDIALGLKISPDLAESLKITYGFALAKEIPRKNTIKLSDFDASNKNEVSQHFLAEIIEVRLAEILELVDNELKVLGRNTRLPAGIVITGGGAKMAGMEELVKQELRLQTQLSLPYLDNFEITNPAYQEMLDNPEFATAVGLILCYNDDHKKSLRPQNFFKRLISNLIP